MKPYLFLIFISICLASCNGKQEVKAIIFERKELDSNQLLIRFRYTLDNVAHVDSAITSNTVVNDTIVLSTVTTPPKIISRN